MAAKKITREMVRDLDLKIEVKQREIALASLERDLKRIRRRR